jgi:hypothetical protein
MAAKRKHLAKRQRGGIEMAASAAMAGKISENGKMAYQNSVISASMKNGGENSNGGRHGVRGVAAAYGGENKRKASISAAMSRHHA